MRHTHHWLHRLFAVSVAGVCLLLASRPASAGDVLKVTAVDATIHAAPNVQSTILARVTQGRMLELIGKQDNWYKVAVPGDARLRLDGPTSGFISARVVEVVPDSQATKLPAGAGPVVQGGRTQPRPGARAAARRVPTRYRIYGEGAFEWFSATKSFDAIVGNSNGPFFGGGVDVIFKGRWDIQLDVTHYQKSGERVIVFNNEVFPLGIAEKISITPIALNVAYRFKTKGRFTPYVGAGGGAYMYNEDSGLAASDTKKTAGCYQVLGGFETALNKSRSMALALELQYQSAPGILGDAGVSAEFTEKDAGGASIRVKLLFGK